MNSRLTLNLGLRYEYSIRPTSEDNAVLGFDPKTHAIVMGAPLENSWHEPDVHPVIAEAYATSA